MPTTITSAGITFNDATSQTTSALAAGAIGTTQLANNAVTAAKLGTTENLRIAKAWVNFNGSVITTTFNAGNTESISVTSGSNVGSYTATGFTWPSSYVGVIYRITQIGGVSNATLGGVDVSTLGFQITSVSGTVATIRLLAGSATSSQTITGTGSSSSGFSYFVTGIRSSYNVSSITKNGTGSYRVNFAVALPDANYSPSLAVSSDSAAVTMIYFDGTSAALSTTGFQFQVANSSFLAADRSVVCVNVFGN